LVGEGRSEMGDLDALVVPGSKRAKAIVQGYVPPVIRRVLGEVAIEAQKVTSLGRFESKAKLPGHAEKAAKALALASTQGFDVLVFVKDVDREGGVKKSPKERAKKLQSMHREIEQGFASVRGAESVRRVKGTPCRMVEAWALGDSAAVSKVTDPKAKCDPCPAAPEALWGDKTDRASGYPKNVLVRVLGREATAEVLEEIARESDDESLAATCPESFAPFLGELRAAAVSARAGEAQTGTHKKGRR